MHLAIIQSPQRPLYAVPVKTINFTFYAQKSFVLDDLDPSAIR